MDAILNCLTGACCPPAERKRVMVIALMEYCKCDEATAHNIGGWILDTFDLAPKGMLTPFVHEIVRLYQNTDKV